MAKRDYWLKLVAAAVSIATLNFSLWTFYFQRRDESLAFEKQRLKDVENNFNQQRTRIYLETSRALSQVATASDEKSFKYAAYLFFVQYWGEMCTVEGPDVEAKMVEIGRIVSSATRKGTGWRESQQKLQIQSVQLGNLFRKYINGAYGTNLAPTTLPADPTAYGGVRPKEPEGDWK